MTNHNIGGEVWKDISGYEGLYVISNHGQIKRVSFGANGASKPGRILKPRPMKNGYLRICLGKKAVIDEFLIHRLVAIAFISEPPFDGAQVNHKNGVKTDNRVENLEWVTHSENVQHSYDYLGHDTKQVYPDHKVCVNCGKPFVANPRKRKRQKCCSHSCAQHIRVIAALKARGLR